LILGPGTCNFIVASFDACESDSDWLANSSLPINSNCFVNISGRLEITLLLIFLGKFQFFFGVKRNSDIAGLCFFREEML